MTSAEFERLVGMKATITERGLEVAVKVVGARRAYGREELLVTPERGTGQVWVVADRVKVRN